MNVFDHYEFDHHEQVVFCHDEDSGLYAIVAIHNTNLGPGAGGCRMWQYDSFDDAVTDALRLSKGMSYKSALAGLPCGGGKSVIIANSRSLQGEAREKVLRAFGRFIQSLGGRYWVAEDVGISVEDIAIVAEECDYVFGVPEGTGDPSPVTARGVFEGIRAAVKYKFGTDLNGIRVAVQGVGHVGYTVCQHLHDAGAELIVTDINQDSVAAVVNDFGATAVALNDIYAADVDVYAPCALGATINDNTIPQLKAKIVAGAANNQLKEARHGQILHDMGILYAPDYVINGGGMINASGDIVGEYDYDETIERVVKIYDTLLEIWAESDASNRPPHEIADMIAERRLYNTQEVLTPAGN